MEGGTPSTKVRRRASILCIVMSLLFVLLSARIFIYQTVQFKKFDQKVIDQITQKSTVTADRGNICDTNGVVLATNVTTYRLFIDPAVIKSTSEKKGVDYADKIAKGLSAIASLGISYDDVIKAAGYTRYRDRTLARNISEESADAVRAFLKESEIDDLALVFLQATSMRYYPYETLASHVLGFTGSDGNGLYGLEYQYDEILAGIDGSYIGAKDSYGNELVYDYESYIPATDGYNIVTTIDVYIQAELEDQLETAYIESGGQNRACGIVLDVETGAVLAMAVYPSYNLNDPWELNWQSAERLEASGFEEGSDEYTSLKQQLLLETWSNKAVNDLYMPGSTFKIITAAMAYEEDLVIDSETFNCPGYHIVNGTKIRCHKTTGHGSLTFAEGIQQSCNPLLMIMGLRTGADRFLEYFSSFGYFEKTGIDLPGESVTTKGVTFWDESTFKSADIYLATASFGQNFKISALSHLGAISAVANGGSLIGPHIIKEVTDNDGNVIYSHEATVRRQVISSDTCKTIAAILEDGVSGDGGAKNAYVAGYRVAAKTGTSEKKDEVSTDYTKYVCSTVAYAPADAPEIATIILVDEPTKGTLYGSVVAAPYVGALLEEVLPYYGVEARYSDEELKKQTLSAPALIQSRTEYAKYLSELLGFEVEVIGDGEYVMSQSPAAGSEVSPGNAKIILYTTSEAVGGKKTARVPDLAGMTAVAANGTLANLGLNIKIDGTLNFSGADVVVVSQDIEAGTEVLEGTVVTVTLRYLGGDDQTYYDPDADIDQ